MVSILYHRRGSVEHRGCAIRANRTTLGERGGCASGKGKANGRHELLPLRVLVRPALQ
jgi:hypothetical protein